MTVVTAVGAADDEPEQPPTNRTAANDRTQRWEQMIGSIEASIDTYRAAEARFEHSWESSDAGDWFPRQVWFQRHLIRRIQSVVADFVGWERLGDRAWDPARSRQQSDRRQPPASPGSNAALDEAIDRLRQVTGRPTGPRASGRPTDHPPTDSARQVEELVERVEKLEAELRRVWTRLVEVEATMKKRRRRR